MLALFLFVAQPMAVERTDNETAALIPLPPVRYRGDIIVTVHFVEPSKLPKLCGIKVEYWQTLLGCAGPTVMFVSNPCLSIDQLYAKELCHEIGHVNHWGKDHGI